MAWHSTDKSFVRHKNLLDRILDGETEFQVDKPESFARTLRGILKYIRDNRVSEYSNLYNAVVRVGTKTVTIDNGATEKILVRSFGVLTYFEILSELMSNKDSGTYVFRTDSISPDDILSIENMCNENNWAIEHERNRIKILK